MNVFIWLYRIYKSELGNAEISFDNKTAVKYFTGVFLNEHVIITFKTKESIIADTSDAIRNVYIFLYNKMLNITHDEIEHFCDNNSVLKSEGDKPFDMKFVKMFLKINIDFLKDQHNYFRECIDERIKTLQIIPPQQPLILSSAPLKSSPVKSSSKSSESNGSSSDGSRKVRRVPPKRNNNNNNNRTFTSPKNSNRKTFLKPRKVKSV
jgi:hypothetical protein